MKNSVDHPHHFVNDHGQFSADHIASLIGAFTPTDEQRRVIEAPLSPLLVVAGAGSGKTETMSQRMLWAVAHEQIQPDAILGLTFSRKAAGELGERLHQRLAALAPHVGLEEYEDPTAMTYNAFAQQIVMDYGLCIGIDPEVTLLGTAAALQMMTSIVEERGPLPDSLADRDVKKLIKKVVSLASKMSDHGLDVAQVRRGLEDLATGWGQLGKPTRDLIKHIQANQCRMDLLDYIEAFEQRKRKLGVIDYGDQLVLANRILHQVPEVVEELRSTYQVVMLDEFQDTSVIQMEVFSTLFRDHPVTAVGDPNQAIYGWRGASAASLEAFLERFSTSESTPAQTLTLSTAWRNDQQILDVANQVAKPLREKAQSENQPVMDSLQPRPGVGAGHVEVAFCLDQSAHDQRIAQFIADIRTRDGLGSTAAVLCRQNYLMRSIDQALREHGIPTQIIASGGLLDQPAVTDVRAALELSVDVGNSPWLMRLLNAVDVGAADLWLLSRWAKHLASDSQEHLTALLLDAVDSPPPVGWQPYRSSAAFSQAAHERVSLLGARLRYIRSGAGRSVVDQVERAIRVLGVVPEIIADPLHNSGQADLDQFVTIAAQYQESVPDATMRGFLQWLAYAEDEERGLPVPAVQPEPGAVQILTVHAAKGLEWDTVVVAGLNDSMFPAHKARKSIPWDQEPPADNDWLTLFEQLPSPLRGDADALPTYDPFEHVKQSSEYNNWVKDYAKAMGAHAEQEERRVAYVALTRARHNMLLAGWWIKNQKLQEPSRYLMEPLMAGLTATTPEQAGVSDPPKVEDYHDPQAEGVAFPPAAGPSRLAAAALASQVQSTIQELQGVSNLRAYLENLGEGLDEQTRQHLVGDALALLKERDDDQERRILDVDTDRIQATGVVRLIQDTQQWALNARRPLPAEPSVFASIGTLFHSWVEQQLRMASATLFEQELPGVSALSSHQRRLLEQVQRGFESMDVAGRGWRPIAVEEPFGTCIAGITIQGRIDAVFEVADRGNDTTLGKEGMSSSTSSGLTPSVIIVDWKTGHTPDLATEQGQNTLRANAIQLLVYRRAWSERFGIPQEAIEAEVVYLRDNAELRIADLERQLGQTLDLDTLIRQAFRNDSPGEESAR